MKLKLLVTALVGLALFAVADFSSLGSIKKAEAYPGADNIAVVQQTCRIDGTVEIRLTWLSYSIGIQWMDLSHSNNGWIFGTFVGAGPFQPWENSWVPWYGIGGGRATFIRINTFDGVFWHPSQTVQFFTRNDCVPQPQLLDTDQDGIANAQDSCPTVMGAYWSSGCPAVPPNGGTDTVNTWSPGQPAPASQCAGQVVGCVWPTKGNGASYAAAEQLRICYWVSGPMNVYIDTVRPDGSTVVTLHLLQDVAPHGNCFNAGVVATPPSGARQLRLFTGPHMGALTQLDSSSWVGP